VPTAVDHAVLSPGVETEPHDCGSGGVGGHHSGAPGEGAAVPAEVGFDVGALIAI